MSTASPPSETGHATLSLLTVREGVHAAIDVTGELDHATADRLRAAARAAVACGAHYFLIECHWMSYLDAGGVAVLVELAASTAEHGGEVTLIGVGATPRRVLRICGADEVMIVD